MEKYDVIIIGAGPAGIAASKRLKKNNISFCIIEKQKFPREKLCGGGLTNKCLNLLKKLDFKFDKINTKNIDNVEVVNKDICRKIKFDHQNIMIDRLEFDNELLKQVECQIFESENVKNIDGNILSTDKGEYEFKYLIFADGVNGYSRNLIKNRDFGFGFQYRYEKTSEKTIIDFSAIKNGYGWIFPKKNNTIIGVGTFVEKKEDYIKLLCNFANKYNFKIDKKEIKGYPIPIYSKKIFEKSVIDNNIILVGDAASLVDPINGEGIYYALMSGTLAAESIIEILNSNGNLKDIYFDKTKNMIKSLDKKKKISKFWCSPIGPKLIEIGLKNDKLFEKVKNIF